MNPVINSILIVSEIDILCFMLSFCDGHRIWTNFSVYAHTSEAMPTFVVYTHEPFPDIIYQLLEL